MKKTFISVFSHTLVLLLLLTSTSLVRAAVGDDPVVTPVSGDMDFSTSVVPVQSLPGTTSFNQMLVPVGFPVGEAQFEGNGILVSGFDGGKATACFTLGGTQWGWGGKIGVWNGTKWVLLPTDISTPADSPDSLACASISSSGTYAFIKWVADPSKLDILPECSFDVLKTWTSYGGDPLDLAIYINPAVPDGTPVSYSVLSQNPLGIVHGTLSGSTTTYSDHFATFPVTYDHEDDMYGVVVRVILQGCYKDVTYSWIIGG